MNLKMSLILVGILTSLVTLFFMYLDSKLFDTPKSKFTYFKNMLLVTAIAVVIVYFMSGGSLLQTGGTIPISSLCDQEIFTGPPPF